MRYNPVQFIVWILVLVFVSFFVAFVCAPLYVIVYCLSGCIAPLSVVLRDDQTFDIGQQISKDLMEKLGIKSNDLISNAYLDLLLAKN